MYAGHYINEGIQKELDIKLEKEKIDLSFIKSDK